MGMLTVASPQSTRGGMKASSSETLIQWSGCLQVHRESDYRVGATFSNPRTPEKAQRRLGGLQKKKKKKKKKKIFIERCLLIRWVIESTQGVL